MKLSEKFITKMQDLLGDSADDFFASLDNPSQKAVTVNFGKISKSDFEKFADFPYFKIENIDNGYRVSDLQFGKHLFSHAGFIYSQEPSAMYPVEMFDFNEGDIVLDVCASPGGKSIQILEKLNGSGLLVSNEIVYNRTKILYENLTRIGYNNFAITCNSPKDFEDSNLQFDKILVDAPCSGEGLLRKGVYEFVTFDDNMIESNARRQLAILNSVKHLLRNGGELVYSTCTYDIRENEKVVEEFLKNNPDFEIVPVPKLDTIVNAGIKIGNYNTNYSCRRYPHLHNGEGQFMAKLRKTGLSENPDTSQFVAKTFSKCFNKDRQTLEKAFSDIADLSSLDIVKRNNTYYALPCTTLDFGNLNVVSIGSVIGTFDKSFKINHNFYHTQGNLFFSKVDLPKNLAEKYIAGEELIIPDFDNTNIKNQICVVSYMSTALGGGKIVDGKLKNYYPKELRIK